MRKIVISLLLFMSFIGYSQTNGITYQALILNPTGEQLPGVNNSNAPMANKFICLKFTIIDQNSVAEYVETARTTTDEFGMVNLIIGTGFKIGGYASSFANILWNNNPKRLKVDLNDNGTCYSYVEISNQPFTAVPFALFAVNSESTAAIEALQATVTANAAATTSALGLKEDAINKSTTTTLGNSDVLFPTQNAVKTYVDSNITSVSAANTALEATVTANATAATNAIAVVQADVNQNEADSDAADVILQNNITSLQNSVISNAAATTSALGLKEDAINKSTTTTLGNSDVLFPTQNAVKTYVDTQIASATIADADATTKGKIQLAGDLAGTAAAPSVPGLTLKAPIASPTFTGSVTAPIYASTPQTLTDAATIDWNPTNGLNASVTLGGNRTLSFSSMPAIGSYGTLVVSQDATGGRTITLPSTSNKVLGSTSTTTIGLSSAANAKDILNFYYDGTNCYWNIGQGYGTAATTNVGSSVSGTLAVSNGGTGSATLTGYVKGNGTSTMTANTSIPVADVTGAAPIASPTFTGSVTAPIYASTPQTLTDAATIDWNPTNGLNASVTLGGNRTLSFSSMPAIGSYGTLVVSQDATGGRTITLPSTSNKVLGSTSTTTIGLSSAANAKDILNFYYDGTNCYWNIGQGYGTAATTNVGSSVSGTLAVSNGGTGSTTQNFVDLTTNQSIAGNKNFNGNIGIGTTSNYGSSKFHVAGNGLVVWGGTGTLLDASGNNHGHNENVALTVDGKSNNDILQLRNTAPNTLLVVDKDGNMGIGNTTPSQKLEVTGNIKTSGTVTAGTVTYPNAHGTANQVLSTTGSGTLAWITPVSSAASLTGTLAVANGGTGATTLTGYVKGNGTSTMTANASIPVADVTGAAPIASPTFTGTPAAPTANAGTNTTQIATTAFVTNALSTSGLPSQSGNSGKFLTTNGSTASWATGVSGSGTLNYIPRFSSSSALSNSSLSDDGTGLRIGNPNGTGGIYTGLSSYDNTRLMVSGGREYESIRMTFPGDPYNNELSFNWYGSAWRMRTERSSAEITDLSFWQTNGAGVTSEKMRIDASGFVKATGFKTQTGTSSQFLKANGTVDNSTYLSGTVAVANGGTGATTLTGYIKGNGTSALTASSIIPVSDVSGAAPLASPALTGTPTAPTATSGTNTTQVATTAFVTNALSTAGLPSQSGNNGKFLTTNGSTASWASSAGVPYSGATGAVNLGDYNLTVRGIKIGTSGTDNFALVNNMVMGRDALFNNTNGYNNMAFGNGALFTNVGGYNNIGIGNESQYDNLWGWGNVSLGIATLKTNVTGNFNTAVGHGAGYFLTSSNNTAFGHNALDGQGDGGGNTGVGVGAGGVPWHQRTYNSTFLGYNAKAQSGLDNVIVIGYNAYTNEHHTIQLGDNRIVKLKTSGTIWSNGSQLTSDARLKTNIQPLPNSIDLIMKLNPVHYTKKNSIESTDYAKTENGFIAQELQKVLPYLVIEGTDKDKILSVDYNSIIPVLTKGIQEQQLLIKAQQKQIDEMRLMLDKLIKDKK
jgi:hypothetical protein